MALQLFEFQEQSMDNLNELDQRVNCYSAGKPEKNFTSSSFSGYQYRATGSIYGN